MKLFTCLLYLMVSGYLTSAVTLRLSADTPVRGHWSQWRGRDGSGVSRETGLPAEWNPGSAKSFWLSDGRSFVVNDTITTKSPSGPATEPVIRKWRLSSDGTLVLDCHFDGPRGQGEIQRVFVRKP